ncbi:MAG: HAD-IA family hydrolase, partial [Nocardioidaceae bacterium]
LDIALGPEAVEPVMEGFLELSTHPDVTPGLRALHDAGFRLVTLSNGSASIAERLLSNAGVADAFEAFLTVDDAGWWKPDSRAYEYAAKACGVELADMLMVAVHPWDVDGAARAGMATAYVDRSARRYPATFTAPTYTVSGIDALAETLAAE